MLINKMRLDVHKLYLNDAIDEILYQFEECKECGDETLQIIHGHKHGTIIRDYIRTDGFVIEMAKNGNEIMREDFSKEGETIFKLNLMSFSPSSKSIPNVKHKLKKVEEINSLDICYKCNEPMILLKDFNWYECPKCGKLKKG